MHSTTALIPLAQQRCASAELKPKTEASVMDTLVDFFWRSVTGRGKESRAVRISPSNEAYSTPALQRGPAIRRGGRAERRRASPNKVDARVDGGKTSAAKGAEWLCRMTVDATFWAKVNKRCVPQAKRKKKDARRGVGSQKKARTA